MARASMIRLFMCCPPERPSPAGRPLSPPINGAAKTRRCYIQLSGETRLSGRIGAALRRDLVLKANGSPDRAGVRYLALSLSGRRIVKRILVACTVLGI